MAPRVPGLFGWQPQVLPGNPGGQTVGAMAKSLLQFMTPSNGEVAQLANFILN
jgi:hypothetical protein